MHALLTFLPYSFGALRIALLSHAYSMSDFTSLPSVGGAMRLPPLIADSDQSEPNRNVTHGTPSTFISSCIEPESVAHTAALLIAAITSP
jgi:hypothetical protein